MIVVHHLENSRSQRVLWLLEELSVDYDVQRYERDKQTSLAPPALKKVHPLGKSPIIDDNGIVVAETGAIIEYIVEAYGGGRLIPAPGTQARRQYTYWLHFAEGSAMSQLLLKLFFSRIKEVKMPFFAKPIAKNIADRVLNGYVDPNITAQLDYIESVLEKSTWFAGDEMTAADIQMSFPLEGAAVRMDMGARYPKIKAFLDRIHALATYKQALERGGPYSLIS